MKKLMIAAAVMCLGLAANAAMSIYWDAYLADSVSMELYCAPVGGVSSLADTQLTSWGGYVFAADSMVEQITSNGTYEFYVKAYDASDRYAISTSTQSITVENYEEGRRIEGFTPNFDSFSDWKTVPEPTSGLLTLCGLALLSLRRKQRG